MGTPVAIAGLWWAALAAGNPAYDLAGRIHPPMPASVSLHGATSPFSASTLSDAGGRFQFHRLLAGTYTVIVFVPGRGEMRRTIEVGPSLADKRGRVEIAVEFASGDPASGALVSARELAVPERAWQEYRRAGQKLERRDVAGAIVHLERALEIAPHFVAAWNHLGTLAYQTRHYPKAETYFRRALTHDPRAFEPLVNLGGVLLTLGKLE
ncbi:MAG: tetratricopeptide repeat protein, partial [Acidobacteria bacterium]|nr:tetratricopeptide repeat protein [Acidobacteriota bacterium]